MAFCESRGRYEPGWMRGGRGAGPARTGPRIMWPCEATRTTVPPEPVHEVFEGFDDDEDPFLE